MGAWIEICFGGIFNTLTTVAPFMGAWIEIQAHPDFYLFI